MGTPAHPPWGLLHGGCWGTRWFSAVGHSLQDPEGPGVWRRADAEPAACQTPQVGGPVYGSSLGGPGLATGHWGGRLPLPSHTSTFTCTVGTLPPGGFQETRVTRATLTAPTEALGHSWTSTTATWQPGGGAGVTESAPAGTE